MQNIPKIQDADLKGKLVLVRVDHNVVKKGKIKDTYRIDASLETLEYIFSQGAKPIVMTHVGRPRDKKTGEIEISEKTAVKPIVDYLNRKLNKNFQTPEITNAGKTGIPNLDSVVPLHMKLTRGEIDGIYLPNTRWFKGEESGDENTEKFGEELASLADIFINDAFGSWQPHASTVEPNKHLPSYAGFLMLKEIENLSRVLNPERPLLAVVAGSKFDTKIGPLTALLKKADYLVLGGVIYNAYLSAKYGFKIKGITENDVKAAENFLEQTVKFPKKIVELPYVVESDILEEKIKGKYRVHNIYTTDKGNDFNYILDISERSFATATVRDVFNNSQTIFVNAVMGFTPNFPEGTIALNTLIDENKEASKLFGGGDTLQDFKTFLPEIYSKALKDEKYYFFTGGGTILKAIEAGSPFGLKPVQAIMNCVLTEKRTGVVRRSKDERRRKQKPVKFERRKGGDRRDGKDRRRDSDS